MKRWPWIAGITTVVVIAGGAIAAGDYVYTTATTVPCGINDDDLIHTPAEFYTPGPGNGPFPGENWDKWAGYDLSDYWMTDVDYETVNIQTADDIILEAWWITPTYPEAKQTSQVELGRSSNLLDRLGLRGRSHTGHGETHGNRRADTLVEKVGFQENLSVGDGNHVGRNVGRNITSLSLDDGKSSQGTTTFFVGKTSGTLKKA